MPFSPVPSEIKPVAHLMKLADEHDQRNVVVAYWARMAACRLALKMVPGKKSPEFTTLLNEILNWLEKAKEEHRSNEGICSETTAQALIEEYALNLFSHAEKQDAAEIFNKNTVKLFYTAGMLFDVLEQFGLSEDLHEKQKYAKWKAAYIHNCLKSGEKPQPGPPNSGNEENNMVHISELPEEEQLRLLEEKRRLQEEQDRKRREEEEELNRLSNFAGNNTPGAAGNMPGLNNDGFQFPKYSPISPNIPQQPGSITPSTPQASGPTTPAPSGPTTYNLPTPTNYGMPPNTQIQLTTEQIQRAQKLTKYATSALNYDDVKTAVENLQKALNLLQFGKE
ncbi:vacuolar protein sorting-associated protein VTA1 homolog [Anthonomus grandis grandis]|uniref:vacuolar protein sorting-associated protein VTA1 homolog n=1 Tax=Anthonomus grandis grandis TaxID=2921223 RepID=UPI0021668094|nr:vacuolar protein sorting-associated protein VTA1 homolog [Anthonomus grandis grandis]